MNLIVTDRDAERNGHRVLPQGIVQPEDALYARLFAWIFWLYYFKIGS
jgi:hypothetical protein